MYTLIQTAKLNDVDPQAWLANMPIPTKPPVCNGMIAPRDSWMMPPPVTR
jgi:IS66 C-terminal element